jgi:hypothetical protein
MIYIVYFYIIFINLIDQNKIKSLMFLSVHISFKYKSHNQHYLSKNTILNIDNKIFLSLLEDPI